MRIYFYCLVFLSTIISSQCYKIYFDKFYNLVSIISLKANSPKQHSKQDIWFRLITDFKLVLPDPEKHRNLQFYVHSYSKNHPHLMQLSNLAGPFIFYILEELEARDLPGELALLPMVESAYKPLAHSNKGASGLWQLISTTGRRYGLTQDNWYDGRRDIAASTQAALDYLEFLRDEFSHDWLLALAAYNAGEGKVKKAIHKNLRAGKPIDFWSLDLPAQTKHFVPKILALAKVIKDRDLYGIKLENIANQPYFENFVYDDQIDFKAAATMANMDLQELKRLNPGHKRAITHPKGPHELLVPAKNLNLLRQNIRNKIIKK